MWHYTIQILQSVTWSHGRFWRMTRINSIKKLRNIFIARILLCFKYLFNMYNLFSYYWIIIRFYIWFVLRIYAIRNLDQRLASKQDNSTNTSMDKDNMAFYYNASHCHKYMTFETFVHLDNYFHVAKWIWCSCEYYIFWLQNMIDI